MADVIDLRARVLQRLGVVAVADEEAPSLSVIVSQQEIAARALQALGIVVPEAGRPTIGVATAAAICARAMQNLGVVVPEGDRPANAAIVTVTELAARALQAMDMPVPASAWPAAATTTTTTAIATAALQRLAVIAADEDPTSTPDLTVAVAQVVQLHDNLIRRGLVSWAIDAIPQYVAQDYALLTALHLATMFGKAGDPTQRGVLETRIGWAALASRAQALAEARVTAIHAGLVAAGLASYASTAIPASVSEPYIALLTIDLAPAFGKQAAADRIPQFEMQIRRDALTRRAQSDALGIVTSVHSRLVALGIADWTTGTIPASVAEDYAELIANNYRPLFGAPQDRTGEPVIEARIRRMSQVLRGQALAEARVAVVHDALVSQGSASWSASAIPQAVADEYAGLVAQSIGPTMGMAPDPKLIALYEERVKRAAMLARGPQLAQIEIEAVHANLAARGKTRWTLQDIPAAAERPYVMLAAFNLAPMFGLPQNQGDVIMATVDLNRIIALPTSGERTRAEYF